MIPFISTCTKIHVGVFKIKPQEIWSTCCNSHKIYKPAFSLNIHTGKWFWQNLSEDAWRHTLAHNQDLQGHWILWKERELVWIMNKEGVSPVSVILLQCFWRQLSRLYNNHACTHVLASHTQWLKYTQFTNRFNIASICQIISDFTLTTGRKKYLHFQHYYIVLRRFTVINNIFKKTISFTFWCQKLGLQPCIQSEMITDVFM